MNARQNDQETIGSTISVSPSSSPPTKVMAKTKQQVVSVAPHDIVGDVHLSREPTHSKSEVFITPRVLDQNAFDELSCRLKQHIDEAIQATADLQEQIKAIHDLQNTPQNVTSQLQERLRLGARMLKAFQGQIDLVQSNIADLQTHDSRITGTSVKVQQILEQFDQRLQEADLSFQRQLQQHIDSAFESLQLKIDERIKHEREQLNEKHMMRCDELNEIIHQAKHAGDQINTSLRLVELAEQNVAAISIRQVEAVQQIEEQKESLTFLVKQSTNARSELAEQLNQTQQRTEYFLQRCHAIHGSLEDIMHRGDTMMQEMAPVSEVIESVRTGMQREIQQFSQMLRTVADHAESLLIHAQDRPIEPDVSTDHSSDELPVIEVQVNQNLQTASVDQ